MRIVGGENERIRWIDMVQIKQVTSATALLSVFCDCGYCSLLDGRLVTKMNIKSRAEQPQYSWLVCLFKVKVNEQLCSDHNYSN